MAKNKMIPDKLDHATYPAPLGEDGRSRFNHTIRRPTLRHVTSHSWSSIPIDRTLQIAPRSRLRANNTLKNQF